MANYAVTLSSARKYVLTDMERAVSGFSHKFTIPYSDLTSAGATTATDTVTVTLGATPSLWAVDKAVVNIPTAYAGTTALTISVGSTSSTSAFVTAQSVLTAGALGMASGVPVLTNATATASVSLVATFTNATGGSISALSAGSLDIFLNIWDMRVGGSLS